MKYKGEKGYIQYKKLTQSLVVLVFVAAGLSIFFICREILGTGRNLGTVFAVLLTLPAAKALVNLLLFIPYQPIPEELSAKLNEVLLPTDKAYYEMVFTSTERVMHLDFLCVRGNQLIAYLINGKNTEKITSYFEASLKKRGEDVHMHVFRKEEELLRRLKSCEGGEASEEVQEFVRMILVK
ncbi:MAG: hypothetical protein MJ064_01385 [Lachnospiraceae bacterium]|nr:hypothetical protein [Lachnospiraceae bacterium]